jgi:hypothetical protein
VEHLSAALQPAHAPIANENTSLHVIGKNFVAFDAGMIIFGHGMNAGLF